MNDSLFSEKDLPSPEPSARMAVRVVTDLSLDQLLDYAVPPELEKEITIGMRVEVPVRNDVRKGYVIALYPESESPFAGKLKPLRGVCRGHARLNEKLLDLGRWMSEYYCCAQESAMRTLLPGAVRSGKIKPRRVKWVQPGNAEKVRAFIETFAQKRKVQVKALETLLSRTEGLALAEWMENEKISSPVMKSLLESEVITVRERLISELEDDEIINLSSEPLPLTDEQQNAFSLICTMLDDIPKRKAAEKCSTPHTLLLHGVTGSGKTEVYLQSIARLLEQGGEAIVLVPEIALTPQTVDRFQARFGNRVSVLHSALSDQERFDAWNKINDGEVQIAVGARSVLFAPFRNLGLIIVDEEHENTYKQSESPRYHARDVAVMRGLKEGAVVILGSATPSFESYLNAQNGRYAFARLTRRADDSRLPSAEIVDMRTLASEGENPGLFSPRLVQALYERLSRGEQTIFFLNRRGFARQLMCEQCGYVATCEHCSVSCTYHRHNATLLCHWCGEKTPAPNVCPSCGDKHIRYSGSGTEKIEGVLRKLCPSARIARMDSDTMEKAEDYEKTLYAFKRGDLDILVGTQMIAKGLHFPKVTLVGILNADLSLTVPDFRAEERTFQLLTQVAGRAGRGGIPGEVIIQTRSPANPSIRRALEHDFEGFWKEESPLRKELNYPPYARMIAVYFRGEDMNLVASTAKQFYEMILPFLPPGAELSEPVPAPLERLKGKWRYLLIVRGEKLNALRSAVRHGVCHGKFPASIDIYADADPVSVM